MSFGSWKFKSSRAHQIEIEIVANGCDFLLTQKKRASTARNLLARPKPCVILTRCVKLNAPKRMLRYIFILSVSLKKVKLFCII